MTEGPSPTTWTSHALSVPLLEVMLARPSILGRPCSDSHQVHILTDLYPQSWFTVRNFQCVAITRKGTRPGDRLADLLFSVLLAPILVRIQDDFVDLAIAPKTSRLEHGCWARGSGPQFEWCTDTTFADDVACITILPKDTVPEHMGARLQGTCECVHRHMLAAGLVPNSVPGKSALMVTPAGKYAHKFKNKLALVLRTQIHLPHAGECISAVSSYKHLGSRLASRDRMCSEMAARRAAHRVAFAPLRNAFSRYGIEEGLATTLTDCLDFGAAVQ